MFRRLPEVEIQQKIANWKAESLRNSVSKELASEDASIASYSDFEPGRFAVGRLRRRTAPRSDASGVGRLRRRTAPRSDAFGIGRLRRRTPPASRFRKFVKTRSARFDEFPKTENSLNIILKSLEFLLKSLGILRFNFKIIRKVTLPIHEMAEWGRKLES